MITTTTLVYLVFIIVWGLYIWQFGQTGLHMFQQNRYEKKRFHDWKKMSVTKTYPLYIMFQWFIIFIMLLCVHNLMLQLAFASFVMIIGMTLQTNKQKTIKHIKPLVYTNRVKRQVVTYWIVTVLFVIMMSYLTTVYQGYWPYVATIMAYGAYALYNYKVITLVGLINDPIEKHFRNNFKLNAQKKLLANKDLIRIGITGSYGKTSSKNILHEILSKQYYSLPTPASYNTPMGITITINDFLKPTHQVFICEMGADKVGEIKELVQFVRPTIGIVTSIGPQHLNTFGSLQNIINEKMQMIEGLDKDGIGILNKDEQHIREYQIKNQCKIIWYAIDREAEYQGCNLKFSKNGSSFDVLYNGELYHFETKLLGKHNVYNILAAIALGHQLGVSFDDLVRAVKQVPYIAHRLELKKQGHITIVDNAFNSNPVGSKMSLDVLSQMDGMRICITPGMIDLGPQQDELNKAFGAYMIDKTDYVILVGKKQTQSIYQGIEESGFKMKNVYVVDKVKDAFDIMYKLSKNEETVVLLENDLPDAFNV